MTHKPQYLREHALLIIHKADEKTGATTGQVIDRIKKIIDPISEMGIKVTMSDLKKMKLVKKIESVTCKCCGSNLPHYKLTAKGLSLLKERDLV